MSLADEELVRLSKYGYKIMELARTSASFKMKFLSNAITFLQLRESQYNLAVDGQFIYYNPLFVIEKYKDDGNYLDYAFLHMTVHCLFQHLFMRKQVDHKLWNAACDIYAFYIIASANDPKLLHNDISRLAEEKSILDHAIKSIKILTPEHLVAWLDDNPDVMDKIIIHSLFVVDSHDVWYNEAARKGNQPSVRRIKKRSVEQSSKDRSDKEEPQDKQQEPPSDEESQEQEQEQKQQSTKCDDKTDDEHSDSQDSDSQDNDNESDSNESDSDSDDSSADSVEDNDEDDNSDDSSIGPSNGDEDEHDSDIDSTDEGSNENDLDEDDECRDNSTDMSRQDLEEAWKNMAQRAQTSLSTGFMKGEGAGSALAGLQQVTRENISYEEFLRKFSVLTEQMVVNMDEFDYAFYTYGLELYGNVPLIEPLEYKDTKRIHDFVIAIDTSGSTFSSLVQKFLSKTFNILSEQNAFDTKVCIHVIQCDTKVRSDVKIESLKDLEEYMRNFQIYGGGGTDFRPVFSYVEDLIAAKEFTDLRGLIYFTDGYGSFPYTPPQYDTAFTFIGDNHCPLSAVPDWAITLELDKDEFKEV